MIKSFSSALLPNQPDPALLEKLRWAHRIALLVVALVATVTLAGWLIAPVGNLLPQNWSNMHAHTALTVLLSVLSLAFSEPGQSRTMYRLSVIFAAGAGVLAATILAEYWFNASSFVDSLGMLHQDTRSSLPAKMSPQSGAALALLALLMPLLRKRRSWASRAADLIAAGLCFVVLAAVSVYLSGAMQLFGISLSIRSAPQTLTCLALLTFVAFWRRAEHGFFAILLGSGIGSRIARTVTPFVLVVPFLREFARAHALRLRLILPEHASAVDAALMAMAAFGLVLVLAWRINGLEREVLELSLRDELTGVYNRKGFMLFAGQALQFAKRSVVPFSVIFIDLDGLKQINDSFGHEAGSEHIAKFGKLLASTFRGTDVVGRIGGDEFVVAGQFNQSAAAFALGRLRLAAEQFNAEPDRIHRLEFSAGISTADIRQSETLDEMLVRADLAMYGEKRQKKCG